MIKVVCDRCGADITDAKETGYIAVLYKKTADGEPSGKNPFEDCHYCHKCMGAACDFLRNVKNHTEETPREEGTEGEPEPIAPPEAKPESTQNTETGEKPEKSRKRKRVDHGKIMALKKAGWSNQKIAEEMHMKPQSVAQSLYMHKEPTEPNT